MRWYLPTQCIDSTLLFRKTCGLVAQLYHQLRALGLNSLLVLKNHSPRLELVFGLEHATPRDELNDLRLGGRCGPCPKLLPLGNVVGSIS